MQQSVHHFLLLSSFPLDTSRKNDAVNTDAVLHPNSGPPPPFIYHDSFSSCQNQTPLHQEKASMAFNKLPEERRKRQAVQGQTELKSSN